MTKFVTYFQREGSQAIEFSDSLLVVEDTGIGMSDEVKDKIFIPFFTTKAVGMGTGLGFAVMHGIVTSYGGDINVESEVEQGSRFIITLPRKQSTEGEVNPDNGNTR